MKLLIQLLIQPRGTLLNNKEFDVEYIQYNKKIYLGFIL